MGDLSRGRRLPADQRREALLEAAERVFADRGFDQARLEDIAQATGVTKAVVYRHFPSKEDLFVAVVADACARLDDAMASTLAEPVAPDVLLSRAVRVWFDYVASHEAAFTLASGRVPGAEAATEAVDAVRDSIVARIASAFRVERTPPPAGISPEQWRPVVEGMIRTIVGGAEAIAYWWARTKPYSAEMAWLTVTNLLWLGVDRLLAGEIWLPDDYPDA